MRNETFKRLLENIPGDVDIFVNLYADLVVKINKIIADKGGVDKFNPNVEIIKWQNRETNLDLRSLARLEFELGEKILTVP